MSQYERYAWLSLLAWCGILVLLMTQISGGLDAVIARFGPAVQQPAALALLANYVFIGLLAAVAEVTIQLALILPRGGSDLEKDERDRIIDARAHLTSYWFTAAALNTLFMHALLSVAFGAQMPLLFESTTVVSVAFALLVVMVVAEIVQRAALVLQYRMA